LRCLGELEKLQKEQGEQKVFSCEPWLWTKITFFNFCFYWNSN